MRILLITLLITIEASLLWLMISPPMRHDRQLLEAMVASHDDPSLASKIRLEEAERRAVRRSRIESAIVVGLLVLNSWALIRVFRWSTTMRKSGREESRK